MPVSLKYPHVLSDRPGRAHGNELYQIPEDFHDGTWFARPGFGHGGARAAHIRSDSLVDGAGIGHRDGSALL